MVLAAGQRRIEPCDTMNMISWVSGSFEVIDQPGGAYQLWLQLSAADKALDEQLSLLQFGNLVERPALQSHGRCTVRSVIAGQSGQEARVDIVWSALWGLCGHPTAGGYGRTFDHM